MALQGGSIIVFGYVHMQALGHTGVTTSATVIVLYLDILRSECVFEGTGLLVHVAGRVSHVFGKPEVGHSVCFTHTRERRWGEGCLRGVCPAHELTLGTGQDRTLQQPPDMQYILVRFLCTVICTQLVVALLPCSWTECKCQ